MNAARLALVTGGRRRLGAAIAARLGLSRNTVRNHVARLYAKIGVNRRGGAVEWGRERGMRTRSD